MQHEALLSDILKYFVVVKEETYLWNDVECILSYKIDGLEFSTILN